MIGYKNIGTGEVCARAIRRATITSDKIIGTIQIFFELVSKMNNCLNVANIFVLYDTTEILSCGKRTY